MKVSKRQCGQVIRCPACGVDIRVPLLEREDHFEDTYLPGGPTGELALVAALSTAEKRLARKARAESRIARPGRKTMLVLLGGAAVLVVLVALLFWPGDAPPAIEDEPQQVTSEPQPPAPVTPAPVVSSEPAEPTPPTVSPAPADQTGPAARVAVEEMTWESDVGQGRYPARLGMLYLRARLRLRAEAEPVSLSFQDEDIVLRLGSRLYPALGTPPPPGPLPREPIRTRREIKPGTSRTLTVLFELPASSASGKCHVRGLGPVPVELPAPPRPGSRLDGQWQEQSPRNLRPLLRHPVMEAIENHPDDRLTIRRSGGKYVVWYAKASLVGELAFQGHGQYRVEFSRDDQTLATVLRLLDADTMVLYLRDEPMYQVMYRRVQPVAASQPAESTPASQPTPASKPASRPASSPATELAPLPDHPDRPRFFGV